MLAKTTITLERNGDLLVTTWRGATGVTGTADEYGQALELAGDQIEKLKLMEIQQDAQVDATSTD